MKKLAPTGLTLLFLVLFLAGLPGLVERVIHEHANTAWDQQVPWGLWVSAYLMFSGASAGAFPVAALAYVFGIKRFRPIAPFALVTALVSLSAALVVVMADLGRPERSFHLLFRPNLTSVMFWVIAMYTMYSAVLLPMIWLSLRPRFAELAARTGSRLARLAAFRFTPASAARNERLLRGIGVFGLLVSMCLAAGVGMLFASLSSQAFWHSGLFPITFIISALVSGTSLVIVGATLLGRGAGEFRDTLLILAKFVGALLAVELVILPVEALVVFKGGIPSDIAIVKAIAIGPHSWVFWLMQVGIGTVGAIALTLVPRRLTLASAATGGLFALIGTFAFRLNFVIPQLAHSLPSYFPNMYEWNFVVFGTGFAGLMLMAFRRVLPLFPEEGRPELEVAPHRVALSSPNPALATERS